MECFIYDFFFSVSNDKKRSIKFLQIFNVFDFNILYEMLKITKYDDLSLRNLFVFVSDSNNICFDFTF